MAFAATSGPTIKLKSHIRLFCSPVLLVGAVLTLLALLYAYGPLWKINRMKEINNRVYGLAAKAKSNPHDARALDQLIEALGSSDTFESTAAAIAIGKVGYYAKNAAGPLSVALLSSNDFLAREAAISLGKIGPEARIAIPSLMKVVREYPHSDRGWFSAESLGAIAEPTDIEVIALLEQAAEAPSELMRGSASLGLKLLRSRDEKSKSK